MMRYHPYNFMASALYHKVFCNAKDETSDWGIICLDHLSHPENGDTHWALRRLKECELISKACMTANVEKILARTGGEMLLVEAPTGPNHFYDLWIKWKCPERFQFKQMLRNGGPYRDDLL